MNIHSTYEAMFDFFNNFLLMNNTIYRDLHIINMALKKDTVEKELHQVSNPWKIKKTSSKACQTDEAKYSNKACQTAPLVPKTLSQGLIYHHMQTQTYQSYRRDIYYPSSNSSYNSDAESVCSIDTVEPEEFIMLDS